MLKFHKQICVFWFLTQDMPGVASSGQLILGSMVLSSFQLNLKCADSGMAEIADVGRCSEGGVGFHLEKYLLCNSSALAFLSSDGVFPGKASLLVGGCITAGLCAW